MRALAVAIIGLGLAISPRSLAMDDNFKVIVHPSNSITEIDHNFLRDAYLKKAVVWPDGQPIRPVDLPSKVPARGRFTHEVLRKSDSQLKSYWSQQIFSGKGVPPQEADSIKSAIEIVVSTAGAVGYVPFDAAVGEAKVIGIK